MKPTVFIEQHLKFLDKSEQQFTKLIGAIREHIESKSENGEEFKEYGLYASLESLTFAEMIFQTFLKEFLQTRYSLELDKKYEHYEEFLKDQIIENDKRIRELNDRNKDSRDISDIGTAQDQLLVFNYEWLKRYFAQCIFMDLDIEKYLQE